MHIIKLSKESLRSLDAEAERTGKTPSEILNELIGQRLGVGIKHDGHDEHGESKYVGIATSRDNRNSTR